MVKQERLYCKNSKDCPQGQSCINGECIRDITPPPPDKSPVHSLTKSDEE